MQSQLVGSSLRERGHHHISLISDCPARILSPLELASFYLENREYPDSVALRNGHFQVQLYLTDVCSHMQACPGVWSIWRCRSSEKSHAPTNKSTLIGGKLSCLLSNSCGYYEGLHVVFQTQGLRWSNNSKTVNFHQQMGTIIFPQAQYSTRSSPKISPMCQI